MQSSEIIQFSNLQVLAEEAPAQRLAAAMQVLSYLIENDKDGTKPQRIDRILINHFIAKLDVMLSEQLDEILHHPKYQQLEASWRSLAYLVDHVDADSNIKVELLDVSEQELVDDFEQAASTDASTLYQHVYTQEYDTPGGEPISVMVGDFDIMPKAQNIKLVKAIADVAASAHCPFIAAANADFFQQSSMGQVVAMQDLPSCFESAEYIAWNAFRETEHARYVGLCLPRFLLRQPYGDENPTQGLLYEEKMHALTASCYLWGRACFAFAANLAKSFTAHGWAVNIRGPQSGGRVIDLPLPKFELERGLQLRIPTEALILETQELALAELGFIPLCYYKNSNQAVFFSANSLQLPKHYADQTATATSRVNTRLPYIFLCSRLAHYLKVLQRENIGMSTSADDLSQELNAWLQQLVTKMNHPSAELMAQHPLRDGRVTVTELPDNPGFFQVDLSVVPHFQLEGVDIRLSLVGRLPRKDK